MVYQGGKTRIVKYICPIIQKYINDNHINILLMLLLVVAALYKISMLKLE